MTYPINPRLDRVRLLLLLVFVLAGCQSSGNSSSGDEEDDDFTTDPSNDDDDDSTTPIYDPPEYCPDLDPDCCLTHPRSSPNPDSYPYLMVAGFTFNDSRSEEWNVNLWNFYADSIKNECPSDTCFYDYIVSFAMRPADEPPSQNWNNVNFARHYDVACDLQTGLVGYDPFDGYDSFQVFGNYSYHYIGLSDKYMGAHEYIIKGLDLFPFIENEVYHAILASCTSRGGSALDLTLEGSDPPIVVFAGASSARQGYGIPSENGSGCQVKEETP